MVCKSTVDALRKAIHVGESVANELLVLSGGDLDLAIEASVASPGLDQCKATIIDRRFRRLEGGVVE